MRLGGWDTALLRWPSGGRHDTNTAPSVLVHFNANRLGLNGIHDIIGYAGGERFTERALVAECPQIIFQRLRLQAMQVGTDCQRSIT